MRKKSNQVLCFKSCYLALMLARIYSCISWFHIYACLYCSSWLSFLHWVQTIAAVTHCYLSYIYKYTPFLYIYKYSINYIQGAQKNSDFCPTIDADCRNYVMLFFKLFNQTLLFTILTYEILPQYSEYILWPIVP